MSESTEILDLLPDLSTDWIPQAWVMHPEVILSLEAQGATPPPRIHSLWVGFLERKQTIPLHLEDGIRVRRGDRVWVRSAGPRPPFQLKLGVNQEPLTPVPFHDSGNDSVAEFVPLVDGVLRGTLTGQADAEVGDLGFEVFRLF